MTTGKSLSSRRGLGGFAALAGGAAMIVSVFLPWLGGGGGDATGWETYTTLSDAGRNGFYEQNFFASGFSPFFSGLVALIGGGLLALIGLAMLASLRGGAFRLPGAGQFILVVLGLLIVIAGATNLASLYATGPGTEFLKPEYGLFVLTGGALIGLLGVLGGAGKGSS
ncbi:MAG: hypothetical protein ABIJ48_05480 [Actinomycetota bacterium]